MQHQTFVTEREWWGLTLEWASHPLGDREITGCDGPPKWSWEFVPYRSGLIPRRELGSAHQPLMPNCPFYSVPQVPSLPFWHQSRVFLRNWLNCGDQAIFTGGKNCLAGSKRKSIKIMILGPRINRFEIRQELKIKSSQAIAGRDWVVSAAVLSEWKLALCQILKSVAEK